MTATPVELLESAIGDVARLVALTELEGASHHAIVAAGLDLPEAQVAIGRYLTGVVAGAIEIDARLEAAMIPSGPRGRSDLDRDVRKLIGDTNGFRTVSEKRFRDQVRNAWIGEGVAHLLILVRSRVETACLDGHVHALTKPHVKPSTGGLDAVAIYEVDQQPYVAITESKATNEYGLKELRKAASMFAKIDHDGYNDELRASVGSLRKVVPEVLRSQIGDALWRHAACYVPAIVFGVAFDHLADRSWLESLVPPIDRRRVLLVGPADYHGFFDAVADAMRAAVEEIVITI